MSNRYTRFFETKSDKELLELKFLHTSFKSRLSKDWYDALEKYMQEKKITGNVSELELEKIVSENKTQNINLFEIYNAGLAIKRIGVSSIFIILSSIASCLVFYINRQYFFHHPQDSTIIWVLLGFINFVCVLITIASLFEAGNHLIKSTIGK